MDWEPLLSNTRGDAVIEAQASEFTAIGNAAEKLGLTLAVIDGGDASDKVNLLAALADALGFPDYFGGNWDALKDCLTDMPGAGWVVVVRGAEELCSQSPADRETFLDIMRSAAAFWAQQPEPLSLKLVLFTGR